jgi:GAF domain-containing protein/anti-sigma regulatory factor (Ser/Thr protein kinase)
VKKSKIENQNAELGELKSEIEYLKAQLSKERALTSERTSAMERTIAESERLSLYLQNTTFALMQERQSAHSLAEREKILNQWIEKVNSSLNITFILKYLSKQMAKYFKVSRCGIVFLQNNKFQIVEYCEDDHPRTLEYRLLYREDFFIDILHSKEIHNCEEIPEQALRQEHFVKDVKSLLSVPLLLRNEVLGLIYLQTCKEVRTWQDNDLQLLNAISYPLMTAIERARLFKKINERTKLAELLNSLTAQIRASLNLKEIFSKTVNELGYALKVSRCFIFIEDRITDEYCATGVKSIARSTNRFLLDKLSYHSSLETINIENLLAPENIAKLDQHEKFDLIESGAKSALATPLITQGELKGWIVFHSLFPRSWSEDDISFVESAASQIVVALTQSEIYEQLNTYQSRISRELKQAARVQSSLIGGDIELTSMDISVLYKPHSNVSGDFYILSELSPNIVAVLIGDVSGKGPAAALLTGYILGQFKALVDNSFIAWIPEKVINFLCDSLLEQNKYSDFYATAWYGVFNLTTGELKYTNAGHLKPYLISNGEVSVMGNDEPSGVPLGLIDPRDVEAFYECKTVQLEPKDKVILLTDGVMDQNMIDTSSDNNSQDWILKSLKNMTEANVQDITYRLNEELNTKYGSEELTDDRLLVCIEQNDFKLTEVDMQNYENCDKLIRLIVTDCLKHGLTEQNSLILRLGLTEAFANVAQYGIEKSLIKTVKVGYEVEAGTLKIVIIDPGEGFNWQLHKFQSIDEIGIESEGGRGIPLLKEIFDKITWNYIGNHLGLFFYWDQSQPR